MTIVRLVRADKPELLAERSALQASDVFVALQRPWIARGGVVVVTRPQCRDLFLTLVVRVGANVTMPDLIDTLFGDDPEGGPYCPNRTIASAIYELRSVIGALGLTLQAHGTSYYSMRVVQ